MSQQHIWGNGFVCSLCVIKVDGDKLNSTKRYYLISVLSFP